MATGDAASAINAISADMASGQAAWAGRITSRRGAGPLTRSHDMSSGSASTTGPGRPASAVDQARAAVTADVGERAQRHVLAAHDDHAFAEVLERVPVARLGDVAVMADDLPGGGEDPLLLELEELGVAVGPGRKGPGFLWAKVRQKAGLWHFLLYGRIATA